MAGGLLNDPYFAFGATLLSGGDIEDAFSIFSQTQNFKEAQKRAALENQQIQQAINEANREAQYKQKMDDALNRAAISGGGMRSMVEAVQPYILGLTGDIRGSMMPQNEYTTLMEDPNTLGQYRIDPFTGEETRIGGGYSDYKRQMDVLQQTFANNQALQAQSHANRMAQVGARNQGQLEAARIGMLDELPSDKLAAMHRANAVPQFFGEGGLGNAVSAVAAQLNLTEDQAEIELNRIKKKAIDNMQGAGPPLTPAEQETMNAIYKTQRAMTPAQSLEEQIMTDAAIPQMRPSDFWTPGATQPQQPMGMSQFDPANVPSNGPTSIMGESPYPGGAPYPARQEEEKGMFRRMLDYVMGQ